MSGSAPSGRRELVVALALGVGGSLLVLLTAGRPWVVLHVPDLLVTGTHELRQTGRKALEQPVALAWLGLAGALVLVAVRGWARVVVGVLLALAGVGIVVLDLAWALTEKVTLAIDAVPIGRGHKVVGWALLSALGGLLVTASGLLALVRGRRWPGMGSSYETPAAKPAEAPVTDKAVWDALDRGDDPTA